MTDYTRRTHIVRISDTSTPVAPGSPPSSSYIDIEVLDAIAFKGEGGKEMVLNMDNAKAVPFIVDETGGGHAKQPGKPTRLSHMKRITSKTDPTQQLDVEVIDVVAFTASNGEEWILDMKATTGSGPDVFNTTDSTGTVKSTRRVHDEKISPTYAEKNPSHYVKVQRCDAMAFRTIMGKEMVIKCPSNDDPNSSDPRASTYIWSPIGYDPSNENGPTPPENKDANVYAAFVKNAGGILTDNVEIVQGPLWWIRKISTGGAYILVTIYANNNSNIGPPPFPDVTIDIDPKSQVKLLDMTVQHFTSVVPPITIPTTVYFVWNDMAQFPTENDYDNVMIRNTGSIADGTLYAQQFMRDIFILGQGSTIPDVPLPLNAMTFFPTLQDAQNYAAAFNTRYSGHNFEGYFEATGNVVDFGGPGPATTVYAAQLDTSTHSDPFYSASSQFMYLYSIPSTKSVESFTPNILVSSDPKNSGTASIQVVGFSDVKSPLKKVSDVAPTGAANSGGGYTYPITPDDPDPDIDNYTNHAGLTVLGVNQGFGTFTVTQSVVAGVDPKVKAHRVQINVTGGDGDAPPAPTG